MTQFAPIVGVLFGLGLLRTGLVGPVVGVRLQAIFLPLLEALFLAIGFGAIALFGHLWHRREQVIAVDTAKSLHGGSPVVDGLETLLGECQL